MLSVNRRLALVRRTGSDAGITLTELLVTMVLMSIVGALALTWLLGEARTDTSTQNAVFATGDARAVLQSWPALLRVADVPSNGYAVAGVSASPSPTLTTIAPGTTASGRFLAVSATSITFNADVANAPASSCGNTCVRGTTTQVTLTLTPAGAMVQQLAQPGATTRTTTFVQSGAALAANRSCLFSTFDAQGNSLGCGPTTALGSIARVTLAFAVTPAQGGSPQTFQSSTAVTGVLDPVVSASATPTLTSPGPGGA